MRCIAVLPAHDWNAAEAIDVVRLDFDMRHRRRIMLRTEGGLDLLLDLPDAVRLREGDGLPTEAGIVRVEARPEPLLEIHGHGEGDLARLAWHLGNRHLPVQVLGHALRIRADHVIADMIQGLGGHAHPIEAPFDPEAGAYHGADHPHG